MVKACTETKKTPGLLWKHTASRTDNPLGFLRLFARRVLAEEVRLSGGVAQGQRQALCCEWYMRGEAGCGGWQLWHGVIYLHARRCEVSSTSLPSQIGMIKKKKKKRFIYIIYAVGTRPKCNSLLLKKLYFLIWWFRAAVQVIWVAPPGVPNLATGRQCCVERSCRIKPRRTEFYYSVICSKRG